MADQAFAESKTVIVKSYCGYRVGNVILSRSPQYGEQKASQQDQVRFNTLQLVFPPRVTDMSREFRHVLRVSGTNIDGTKNVVYGLTKIIGVGPSYAAAVVKASELKPSLRVGELSEAEIQKLEDVMHDPAKYGLPARLYNRRKSLDNGRDLHLIGPDATLSVKNDIDFMIDIRTWKGVRHSLGLKVRGQRTRTTGRKGRAVGVAKKIIMEAARTAAAEREKEEKK